MKAWAILTDRKSVASCWNFAHSVAMPRIYLTEVEAEIVASKLVSETFIVPVKITYQLYK